MKRIHRAYRRASRRVAASEIQRPVASLVFWRLGFRLSRGRSEPGKLLRPNQLLQFDRCIVGLPRQSLEIHRGENGVNLHELRVEYSQMSLDESEVAPDPIRQFEIWLEAALRAELPEPYAMTLATATPDGSPSARIVLLRACDDRGFTFFTNYNSRKAKELDFNPKAALVFHWQQLERQVRIEGTVQRVTAAESDAYFAGRPAGSQLGAWASPQSEPIPNRGYLETRHRELESRFAGGAIPRPENWGGYRLFPTQIEFWQGRRNRLHDRILYLRHDDNSWRIQRLAP
jgi:pyridoxamine 5'-phosphate oxidase